MATTRHVGPHGARTLTSPVGLRNVHAMLRRPLEHLQHLQEAHGDVVEMPMLSQTWLLLVHPADVESLLVAHHPSLVRDEFAVYLRRVLGQGLLTSDGDLWKRQRRLSSTAFTPKRIRGYAGTMSAVTDRGLARIEAGRVSRLHEEMSRLTMEVVAEVLFGAGITDEDVQTVSRSLGVLNSLLTNSLEAAVRLPAWIPTPNHRRAANALADVDRLVRRIIDDRRRSAVQRDDLLSHLLNAVDEDGSRMSDTQLRDETLTLFLAGHETTSLALTHALYLLGKHPDVLRRVHAEVDDVLRDGTGAPRLPTEEDVPRLSLVERVIKEGMRLFPPAWIVGREVAKDIEIAGRRIEKGTQAMVSQWLTHRDPRWWPRPEAFDPDRFLPEIAKTRPRFAYFPFGGGPRVCIGNHFAMMEAILMLSLVVSRFEVELIPFSTLRHAPSITLQPADGGVRVRFVPRTPRRATTHVPTVGPEAITSRT
ncbi:MAG: cytochrome P450 [Deltaproteobacteria bacterium]|nr:cytochrome P450 [Deltaproteobacteria bacterium]